jgi:hypothetical protein
MGHALLGLMISGDLRKVNFTLNNGNTCTLIHCVGKEWGRRIFYSTNSQAWKKIVADIVAEMTYE